MAMAAGQLCSSQLVSENVTGATFDNRSDPYFVSAYSEIYAPHQDLAWPRQEEISYPYQETLPYNLYAPTALPVQQSVPRTINYTPRTSSPPSRNAPEVGSSCTVPPPPPRPPQNTHYPMRYPTSAPVYPPPRYGPVQPFNNPPPNIPLPSPEPYPETPTYHLHAQPTAAAQQSNSRNPVPCSQTFADNTLKSPQTQNLKSPSLLISELVHSIETLESMEFSTIIMSIESINTKIGDIVASMHGSLLASSLSKTDKKMIHRLPHRIWNICLDLTKEYPEGYDMPLNEFGLFAIILDELLKIQTAVTPLTTTAPIQDLPPNTSTTLVQDLQQIQTQTTGMPQPPIFPAENQNTDIIQTTHEAVLLSEVETVEVEKQLEVALFAVENVDENMFNADVDEDLVMTAVHISESKVDGSGSIAKEKEEKSSEKLEVDSAYSGEFVHKIVESKLSFEDELDTSNEVAVEAHASNAYDAYIQPSRPILKTENIVVMKLNSSIKGLSDFCMALKTADNVHIDGYKRTDPVFETIVFNESLYKPPWPPPSLSLDLEDKVVLEGEESCNDHIFNAILMKDIACHSNLLLALMVEDNVGMFQFICGHI